MVKRSKESYNTKQREHIIHFLKDAQNRHFTAEEIHYALSNAGSTAVKSPALATVYRTLDKLVKDGCLRKYIGGEGGKACYQYISEDAECAEHYHLKCTNCGILIHLNCDKIGTLVSHIRRKHSFVLDTSRTVLYGLCADCSKNI
ncbi:transcriptional repressor [Treponema sp. OMZ 840]|uniref:Fur family transcriptional regulator n=1 Tax=Treponema sp. OMZ 840 TaxID=244313 RepID=UPI003D89D9B4